MRRILMIGACAMAVAVAGCGSDEESNSTATTGSGGASSGASFEVDPAISKANETVTGFPALTKPATIAELEPRVAKYEEIPQELLIDEPVSKKATPGKNIALLFCGVPICTTFNNAMAEAAELLGWKVTRIPLGVSPEEFTKAYNQAIEVRPDMVISSGLTRELFDKQLDTLQEMNIPVVQWSAPMEPVEDHLWVTAGPPLYQSSGVMLAEKTALDSNLKGKVVSFSVPVYGLIDLQAKVYEDYLPKICPDCSVEHVDLAVGDIGKAGPKVTAYLQQNPETKYVLCGFGDLCIGVAQAIKAAGFEGIKILSKDTDAPNVQNIFNGTELASIPLPIEQTGYMVIDLAQRIFNGDDTSQTAVEPQMIITKATIDDPKSTTIGAVPGFKEKYKSLWKLEG